MGTGKQESSPGEVSVRVTAEGIDRDDALRQALRKALEEGIGVQLASCSQTRDFVLVRDTIYTRAAGLVRDYRILEQRRGAGGTVVLDVEAIVRPDVVAQAWGEVQHLLDVIGRPRILVWFDERIDGRLQPDSVVAARIEGLLVQAGFDLVARPKSLPRSQPSGANNAVAVREAAKQAGAHLVIQGTADADRAGLETLYGIPFAFYNCNAQARLYAAETGRLLASVTMPTVRRGVRARREYSPQAARAALLAAACPDVEPDRHPDSLARRLYEAVMSHWATQLTGGEDLELVVEPLDFQRFMELKQALAEMDGVLSVHGDFSSPMARYRLKSLLSAEALAARLAEREPFRRRLEIVELKPDRIRARSRSGGDKENRP